MNILSFCFPTAPRKGRFFMAQTLWWCWFGQAWMWLRPLDYPAVDDGVSN